MSDELRLSLRVDIAKAVDGFEELVQASMDLQKALLQTPNPRRQLSYGTMIAMSKRRLSVRSTLWRLRQIIGGKA